MTAKQRFCSSCGGKMSRYNDGILCYGCERKLGERRLEVDEGRRWYQQKAVRERNRKQYNELKHTYADMLVWVMRKMQMPGGTFSATKEVLMDLTQFTGDQLRSSLTIAIRRGDIVKLGTEKMPGQAGRRNLWKVDYDRNERAGVDGEDEGL